MNVMSIHSVQQYSALTTIFVICFSELTMPTNPDEPYYCSQQINIPPELPDILKQFTKAAIRTQPKDCLAWSAA